MKKNDEVMVMDVGLIQLYNIAKRFDPNTKPNNLGWVEEVMNDGQILVKFPIGDEDPEEHSQVAPYPRRLVVKREWSKEK